MRTFASGRSRSPRRDRVGEFYVLREYPRKSRTQEKWGKSRNLRIIHTCASLLHEQGADARMIMEVLGHSSIRVTMDIYTFVRLDSQRSAFDRVGDALRKNDDSKPGAWMETQSRL